VGSVAEVVKHGDEDWLDRATAWFWENNQNTTLDTTTIRAAFLQGDEDQVPKLFGDMLRSY
jgi:hypothetical protein